MSTYSNVFQSIFAINGMSTSALKVKALPTLVMSGSGGADGFALKKRCAAPFRGEKHVCATRLIRVFVLLLRKTCATWLIRLRCRKQS